MQSQRLRFKIKPCNAKSFYRPWDLEELSPALKQVPGRP